MATNTILRAGGVPAATGSVTGGALVVGAPPAVAEPLAAEPLGTRPVSAAPVPRGPVAAGQGGAAGLPLSGAPDGGLRLRAGPLQTVLFCRCGQPAACRFLCRRCYQREADSRRRFGGERERVLRRDHHRCIACGTRPERPHVHHRRPGCNQRRWLATVCAACHARVHRIAALRRGWVLPPLVELWSEQHPHTPVQLQFFTEAG